MKPRKLGCLDHFERWGNWSHILFCDRLTTCLEKNIHKGRVRYYCVFFESPGW